MPHRAPFVRRRSLFLPRASFCRDRRSQKGANFFSAAFTRSRREEESWNEKGATSQRIDELPSTIFFSLFFLSFFIFGHLWKKNESDTDTVLGEEHTKKGTGVPPFFFNWSHARIKRVRETTRVCVRVCVRGCAVQNRNKDGQGIDKREKRGCRERIVSNRSLPGCYLYISRLLRVFFFCSSHRLSLSLSLSLTLCLLYLSLYLSLFPPPAHCELDCKGIAKTTTVSLA